MILQLDPDDDEAEHKAADSLVESTTDKLEQALRTQLNQMAPEGAGNMPPEQVADAMVRNSAPTQRVQDILAQALREGADLGVSVAVQQFERIGYGFDWTLSNVNAREWADRYTALLVQQITETNRRIVQQATSRWVSNGEPLTALIRELEPHFGRKRAELIASTEVTRAYFEGNQEAYRSTGVVEEVEWRTAVDERVCPICGPQHGKRTRLDSDWNGLTIPAHPRCRCWIAPVVADRPEVPEWKPSMSRAEAERWAANSQYKADVFHTTTGAANVQSIKENGFDLSRRKFGRMWGNGVYVAADDATTKAAKMYRRWSIDPSTLTIKINVSNIFVYEPRHEYFDAVDIIEAAAGVSRQEAYRLWYMNGGELDKVLANAGYDAFHLKAYIDRFGEIPGGNQIVVFDPKKVVVIND